jgi:hypothetical protein
VTVRVRYDPTDPERADLAGPIRIWLPVAGLLLLGAAFLYAALAEA